MAHTGKFKFTDLIVLTLILLVGIALFSSVHRVREYAWSVRCAASLKWIGSAMLQYAADNHGQFPRTRWDPDSSTVNAFTNPSASDPFAADGPLPNDVTASLYLLARYSRQYG